MVRFLAHIFERLSQWMGLNCPYVRFGYEDPNDI